MDKEQLIIGIDPGSRITGFGIIQVRGQQHTLIDHGHIRCTQKTLNHRLYNIQQKLDEIIAKHQPDTAAIEQVFTCINPQSAIKLGQARGVAIATTAKYELTLAEYSAREVKKSVVGYGAANKLQVQHMVRSLLKLTHNPQADAADALAIAICHANHQNFQRILAQGDAS